ncbi:MAG: hypothetical protein LJE62_15975 [Silicimonas sp.]|jgi:ABC-type nickel/cobalt efflux system permease component RcnA|nr:hypothetical protein [Silicimonas sp.]
MDRHIEDMEFFLGVAPLGIMFVVAVWLVWRGMRTRPDDRANRAKGGGAHWRHW